METKVGAAPGGWRGAVSGRMRMKPGEGLTGGGAEWKGLGEKDLPVHQCCGRGLWGGGLEGWGRRGLHMVVSGGEREGLLHWVRAGMSCEDTGDRLGCGCRRTMP